MMVKDEQRTVFYVSDNHRRKYCRYRRCCLRASERGESVKIGLIDVDSHNYQSSTLRRKSGISSGGAITRSFSNPQSGLKITAQREDDPDE